MASRFQSCGNTRRRGLWWLGIALLLPALVAPPARGAGMEAELRVTVTDAGGLPLPAEVTLRSWVAHFEARQKCGPDGVARFRRLPLGPYQLTVRHAGFQPFSGQMQLETEIPAERRITLDVEPVETVLTVRATPPLLDPSEAGMVLRIGREELDERPFTTLGRSAIEAVNSLPGWLLEANAVLHPRGSEYDTQYVIDGMPLYDNRSLAFAPPFESEQFEAVHVMTGGLPAEFGRRLGGVIELFPRRNVRPGHHLDAALEAGSFSTRQGSFFYQHASERNAVGAGLRGGVTDRYLDPPSVGNFTNHASSGGGNLRFDRDVSDRGRLSLYLRSNRAGFLVPNDMEQQLAGQRQDRSSGETAGHAHYQHVFSPRVMGVARGMVRDVTSRLWSNIFSTPVFSGQDRGFRESVASGALTIDGDRHTWKLGADVRVSGVREQFLVAESSDLPEFEFGFQNRQRALESAFFVQNHMRWGDFVLDAGLRFDTYSLLIEDRALSPRVAAAYYWPRARLQVRAAYDRVFQTPPLENLLLSSSAEAQRLTQVEGAIPVPASRADFFEAGVRRPVGSALRLDVSHYWRHFENYFDDDVFLNTGVSFPISFAEARIEGTEVRLEMPGYRGWTAFLSYANMKGTATSPVTGGLFVEGGEAEELRDVRTQFPVTQDQRNTVTATVRYEPHARVWVMTRTRYGSGLPVELDDDDEDNDDDDHRPGVADFGGIAPEILDRVNFERGRVRPNFNLDFSVGFRLWRRGNRSLDLQVDVINSTNRLNVINFSGLFSGTALAPPRMAGIKLRARF